MLQDQKISRPTKSKKRYFISKYRSLNKYFELKKKDYSLTVLFGLPSKLNTKPNLKVSANG